MENVFIQHQSSNGEVHSGIFVVGWQTQSNDSENVTVADLTSTYDSQSNTAFAQSTGTPLADELVNTGVIIRSNFFSGYVIAESSGSNLRSVASNLVAYIKALGDNWYAVLITPQSEPSLQKALSDSRTSS